MTLPRFSPLLAALPLLFCVGCPQYRDATVPNEIERRVEPQTNADYLLYVPSNYNGRHPWPLIILCHGTRPWDNADRQMLDWVKLAEEKGFLVTAVELSGTSAIPKRAVDDQIARQIDDERRILGAVRQIRGAYSISDDRIFLTGWSAGSFAVLHTGLRHPEVFRAIALQQGNFDSAYLAEVAGRIDPHQPVCVIYGSIDMLTGADAKKCVAWLEKQKANLHRLELSGGHRGHPEPTQEFFDKVLRREPWLHIRALGVDDTDPLTVHFKTRGSFVPNRFKWQFGDGQESPVSQPVHRFDRPGTYQVTLDALTPKKRKVKRNLDLTVPLQDTPALERTTWTDPK